MSALPTSSELEEQDAQVARNGAELSQVELVWRDRQPFLQSKGYMLRPRLRPGWIPSWTNSKSLATVELCEDFTSLPVRFVFLLLSWTIVNHCSM